MKTRLVFVSDTHAPLDLDLLPEGDFLGVTGDLLSEGDRSEWRENLPWLTQAPHAEKAFVPGNHDWYMQERPGSTLQDMRKAGFRVLGLPCNPSHQTMTLSSGLVVGGCPFVPNLENRWAFGEAAFAHLAPEHYGAEPGEGFNDRVQKLIEDDMVNKLNTCDIIMTHAPIFGILDYEHDRHHGAECFLNALHRTHGRRRTRLWVHGHTHSAAGFAWPERWGESMGILVCNAAISDRQHRHSQGATVVEWDTATGNIDLLQHANPK